MTTDPTNTPRNQLERHAALRVIDAASNRAGEGLRVIEDFVRFVLNDSHLTTIAKSLRHDLAAAIQAIDREGLLAARETLTDVGIVISTAAEQKRHGLDEIVVAACKRLEQSLRSLEEYSKLIEPTVAGQFETIRYRSYTLERIVHIARRSQQRLAQTRLYVLIDGRASDGDFRYLVRTLVEAGVHALQLRDKSLDDRALLQRALALREITRETGTLAIVNDRSDIAALSQADGVHVGQEELSVAQVRAIVGPGPLIGVSTHSISQARQAVLDGADYLGIGPTFPSTTKAFDEFPGLPLVGDVAREVSLPAFAIGGMTLERVAEVLAAGLGRIAVGAAIADAADPADAVRKFLLALKNEAGCNTGSEAGCHEAIEMGATQP